MARESLTSSFTLLTHSTTTHCEQHYHHCSCNSDTAVSCGGTSVMCLPEFYFTVSYEIVYWYPTLLPSSCSFGDKPWGIGLDIHGAQSKTPNAFCDPWLFLCIIMRLTIGVLSQMSPEPFERLCGTKMSYRRTWKFVAPSSFHLMSSGQKVYD